MCFASPSELYSVYYIVVRPSCQQANQAGGTYVDTRPGQYGGATIHQKSVGTPTTPGRGGATTHQKVRPGQGGATIHQSSTWPSLFVHFQLFHPAEGSHNTKDENLLVRVPESHSLPAWFLHSFSVIKCGGLLHTGNVMYAFQVLEPDLIHRGIHFGPQALLKSLTPLSVLYNAALTYMRPASYSMVIKSYTYARLWSNNFTHLSPLVENLSTLELKT